MRRVALTILALAACGDDAGRGDDARDAAPLDPGPQLDDTAAWVELTAYVGDNAGAISVDGHLVTEPTPWPYTVEPAIGACRYSTLDPPTCAVPCAFTEVCVDDACAPSPPLRSAGDLVLASAGESRTIPFAGGYNYYEQTVPFPAGAGVTLTATGGEIAAFTAATVMPEPLELLGVATLDLRADADLTLRWRPADPGSRIRLVLGADRGHALLRAALIECDLADEAGSVTIPAATIARFVDPTNWSCGDCLSHEIKRYRRARTDAGPTPVTFWLSQGESLYLRP